MQSIIKKTQWAVFTIILLVTPLFAKINTEHHSSNTIVMIHGLFQNGNSWIKWKTYFEERGFQVYTPSYPYHDGDPTELNANVDERLVNLDFEEVLTYMTAFIDSLPEKPIIIGHSIGGLLMQKLVESDRASLGIALASANPRGISVNDWKYIRSNFRMVNPFRSRNKVCRPPLRWFRYTFFNTINDSLAAEEHRNFFVPESRIIAKSSTEKGQEINFSKPHVPLLFISGEKDNDLPPKLIYKNFSAYTDSTSSKAYYQFPGRSHYMVSEPGWEEVARYVYHWITKIQHELIVVR
ncbi:MAG: alpha/beta fold hydrolase [Cyclobacteriaceae bacterium]|nr:alpha/beta fold hydrolase [Cyclobacteriaceae bacterium]